MTLDMSGPHVVIIGGGFAGLSAGKALRGKPVRVTIVDRRNHHLFQPLLYQVATATLSPGDIASPIRWIFRHAQNVRVILGDADAIDTTARRVHLGDGATLDYDYLIIGTGARHAYFNHPEWEPFAPGLKTLEDALEIRRRILVAFERAEREADDVARQRELLTFVLVGGGPTGVELAGTLAEIAQQTLRDEFRSIDTQRARIVLVEAGPTVLAAFPEKLRRAARASLIRLGVEVREGVAVTGIDAHGVWLGAERLAAGTVLWAAGVAASPLVATLGVPLDRAGRVVVEPDLSIPGHPEVFVAGDAAAFTQDGALLPGVAQTAMQGAAHAARTILDRLDGKAATRFVYRDLGNMAIVGRNAAIADIGRFEFSGTLAWLVWLFLHIFMLIGFRSRVLVFVQWATSYLTFQRSVRLITYQDQLGPR
jgi:NADH:ubiquinone reductase (H+-translocating)